MLGRRLVSVIALLMAAVPLSAAAAGSRILLVARDHEEHLLSGFRFAYQGIESLPTNPTGVTELDLPPEHRPGQQIKIYLLVPGSKRSEEWFLVDPLVNIPASNTQAEVVLMRRSAFRQIAAEARDASRQAASSQAELTEEERKRVLVEAAARHGLTAEQLDAALRSFAETQDPTDKGIAAYLEGEFLQAEEFLTQATEKKESDLVETLRYLGVSQFEQAKYRAAADTFRKAVALRSEDSDLLSWLGNTVYQLAEWTEAEQLMRRSLEIDEKSFGPDDWRIGCHLNNLAALLQATNRLAEAEPLMRQALMVDEKNFGIDSPDVARDLNNLALLLQATNRLAEAEPLMRRALAISQKCCGMEHPSVATHLNSLASLLQDTNRIADAEPLVRRALAIDEKNFGVDHPRVGIRLNNLASLLQATNRLAEAEPLMRRALAIEEKVFGPNHSKVSRGLSNLASLLLDTNRFAEAETLMRRVLVIDEQIFGPDHPRVALQVNNLATLLSKTNRLGEAEPLMRRALAANERNFGQDHPDVAILLNNLSSLLQATERFAEAEPLLLRALVIDEKSFGPDHPNVARDLSNLAALLTATNRLGEAESSMRRALAIFLEFERRTGYKHPYWETVSGNYREVLKKMGRTDAEIEMEFNALDWLQ